MNNIDKKMDWFVAARYGMFVHFGLYSMLGRGEWTMNRERILPEEYRELAKKFNPKKFDADAICRLAVDGGMKYVVFTTMHHDGFRLYDTDLTDFCSAKTGARRDFVAEMIQAARRHGLKIGLYHSLGNWFNQPDGVDALESKDAYETFIANTFARFRELLTRYNPVDILWYDGWWPFHAKGWRAEEMNAMARSIQPNIILNGRNGLPGDFGTPEGHMTAPSPWRPWEACMTLNDHWGYHRSDNHWKTPLAVTQLLATAANGRGNLLLNIGPRGDGTVPAKSAQIVRKIGDWLKNGGGGEALFDTDIFTFGYEKREGYRSDWDHHGSFTAKGDVLYLIVRYFPGPKHVFHGLNAKVLNVSVNGEKLAFAQRDDKVEVALPAKLAKAFCPVLKFECSEPPSVYRTGGMRVPNVPHPPYDPCPSDIGD